MPHDRDATMPDKWAASVIVNAAYEYTTKMPVSATSV